MSYSDIKIENLGTDPPCISRQVDFNYRTPVLTGGVCPQLTAKQVVTGAGSRVLHIRDPVDVKLAKLAYLKVIFDSKFCIV